MIQNSGMPPALRRLVTTSFIYILLSIVAGTIAISRNLPTLHV